MVRGLLLRTSQSHRLLFLTTAHETHPALKLRTRSKITMPSTRNEEQPKEHHSRLRDAANAILKQVRATAAVVEKDSEAHQMLRKYKGNVHGSGSNRLAHIPSIEHPSNTGVIYVTDRAAAKGWSQTNKEWGNFGQGAPEVGHIEGGVDKPLTINMHEEEFEYAPVAGVQELREAVANLYNERYRRDHASKYTANNVCIVPGGRAGLTRIAAVLGDANVGFFLPDYTAYEQLLTIFKRFIPIPTPLRHQTDFHISADLLQREVSERGLGVIVCSNPANPTGQVVKGDEMKKWIQIAKEQHCTLVLDEFYSSYIYHEIPEDLGKSVSSAQHIEDVNADPVIIVDGLTKNFRLPGWRVCWIVGPEEVVSSLQSAGSFLDGGTNHVLQRAAIPLLDPQRVEKDAKALQTHFRKKRDYVVRRLREMGFPIERPPSATFYVWVNLERLPEPLNNGLSFFEEALSEKVIVVPGIFFDINPGRRRELFNSPFHHYLRLSFGPPMEQLEKGLDGIERLLRKHGVEAGRE
ncbi:aminotransferase [Fimicolochytrium jonesii]|uniref:aminotransferase n=1 Tax=Fimicolochytrium jonesii TaxID=1396493 RepID=UPI0022FEC303|nr:aminotransferase [Fimicolochytrium jonesii]KAI8819694.1 aminotransferase [Fimicolochytrium jonesii]